jgi:hypothetical protein
MELERFWLETGEVGRFPPGGGLCFLLPLCGEPAAE